MLLPSNKLAPRFAQVLDGYDSLVEMIQLSHTTPPPDVSTSHP